MSSKSPVRPLRIAVVGGGIVGLALAVPLARAQKNGVPIEVHVYEAAHAFTEIGAGVGMGPNAQRILRRMGLDECLDKQVDPGLIAPDLRNRLFDVRRSDRGLALEDTLVTRIFGQNAGLGAIHRADFLDSLVAMFPADQVTFHKRLTSYIDQPSSPIQLTFLDGTTAEADVLIGSDGIKSATRRCMYSEDTSAPGPEGKATRAKYSGWVSYRALIPTDAVRGALGDLALEPTMWIGRDRNMLTMPLRHGELLNVVAVVRDRTGERAVGRTGPWSEEVPHALLEEDMREYNDTCQTVIKAVEKATVWGIFDLPELPWFNQGRVALAGDAAHASTPHQGAGAGSGIEDSFILYTLLTHPTVLSALSSGASQEKVISTAMEAYSHVRRPRATRIQRTSAETGMLTELHMPGVMDDYQKIADVIPKRFPWIWEWKEDDSIKEALDYFTASLNATGGQK